MGAGIPQNLPAFVAQQRALEAAIRRQTASTLPGTRGPVRLGGGNLASLGLTPRELVVLVRPWHFRFSRGVGHLTLSTQAADMRAADEKICGSGTLAQQEAEKAARDSHHNDAIDLTGDSDIGDFDFSDDLIIFDDVPSGSKGPHSSQSTGSQPPSQPNQPTGSRPGASQPRPPGVNVLTKPRPPPIKKASKPPTGSPWTCPTCTLINQLLALQCDACLAPRPPQTHAQTPTDPIPTAGWTCGVCGEQGMEHTFWTCRFCGSVKTESTLG